MYCIEVSVNSGCDASVGHLPEFLSNAEQGGVTDRGCQHMFVSYVGYQKDSLDLEMI